eukprot:TCONS_00058065-protein
MEYLTKYDSKPEKLSAVASDAISHVASNASKEADSSSLIKKIMMRAVGKRDISIQEVCHHLLQLNFYSSSFKVITVSLSGSRKLKNYDGQIVSQPSFLDVYANRADYSADPNVCKVNFIDFHSNYVVVKDSLVKRKQNCCFEGGSKFSILSQK